MNTSITELSVAIAELRELFPDWRMGQVVANLTMAAGGTEADDIWEMEDDKLLEAAQRLLERNRPHRRGNDLSG